MPRRLGKTDYSVQSPLAAVIDLMDRCEDAIVLGYPYHETSYSMTKCGNMVDERMAYVPTPWNQIEGTLAYRKGIPVLVVAQKAVEGGLFDIAVTGEFLCKTDLGKNKWFRNKEFMGVFQDWKTRI